MKAIALVLSLVCVVPVLADPELDKLQTSYKNAVERAVKPINTTYEAELRKLLAKQTAAKDLEAAKATLEEIQKLTGEDEARSLSTVSDKETERMVVGRTWKLQGGSTYSFRKSGEGTRLELGKEKPFLWRVVSPGLVRVSGNLNPDGSERVFFFRLVSLREGYYGNDEASQTMTLTLADS
jgi:hypothetical protein